MAGDTPASPGSAHFLTFTLGAEPFAIDIRTVREIIQVGAMTPVPLMPDFVRGVINLRGAVVPVIDTQARFGRPPAAMGKKTCIVVVEAATDAASGPERLEMGLLVDAVSAVVEIGALAIEPAPDFGATVRRDFIRGMARLGGRFVTLLEPAQAFDVDDMAALCEQAQAEPACV